MTRQVLIGILLLAFLVPARGAGQNPDKKPEAKALPPQIIKLAPQSEKKTSSLASSLLVDPLDRVEGNSSVLWMRAIMAARAVRYKWTDKHWSWDHPSETPLHKLPRKEVKEVLDKHASALRLADQAALRTRCEWEWPAPTIQNLGELPLDEIGGLRQIAHLLNLRCRLALSESKFDDALKSLRTGFALARHVGKSHTVVQSLVAVAVASIMIGRVDEWVQAPGSPNLYWALTELPRPLIDTRTSMSTELNTIYRSFPGLRLLKKKTVTAEEAKQQAEETQRQVEKVFELCAQASGPGMPAWMKKLSTAALTLKYYPRAKKGLIDSGRTEKEIESMPKLQVVAVYYLEQYDKARDEILQWLAVPAWQGREQLMKVEAKFRINAREDGNVLLALLMPALVKVYEAQLRTDRYIAGLRGAEALRMHLASTGKLPAKWSDITRVPGPIDPFTGKGLEEWYRLDKEKGTLDIPAPPGMPGNIGRRFEITIKGRSK